MKFESELKNGRFIVGECEKCRKISWPPQEFCNTCFGSLNWRQIKEPGKLLEWSSRDGKTFGMVEFENIRVIGSITDGSDLSVGEKIKIVKCEFDNDPKFTFSKT